MGSYVTSSILPLDSFAQRRTTPHYNLLRIQKNTRGLSPCVYKWRNLFRQDIFFNNLFKVNINNVQLVILFQFNQLTAYRGMYDTICFFGNAIHF